MDVNALMPTSRKKCFFEGKTNGEAEDRISCLPATLLFHILSFVPTKYAVATSILSRRWKYVWTSISKLEFSDKLLHSTKTTRDDPFLKTSFVNFVNRVLLLHDKSPIDKFLLSCSASYDEAHINVWISTVLLREVQELILSVPLEQPFVFPRCLFSCNSLTTLRINFLEICYLKTPPAICFSNLKFLNLQYVRFYADDSTQKAFLSFPVLEEFYLYDFQWQKFKSITISAPSLKRLTMDDYDHDHHTEQDCEIFIYAESLVNLDLTSAFSCKFSMCNLLSLVKASIDVTCGTGNVIKLLTEICCVKRLNLSHRMIENLLVMDIPSQVPMFLNLVHLEMDGEYCTFDATSILINLLSKMPSVESFTFYVPCDSEYIDPEIIEVIPHVTMSHLKFVEFYGFDGNELELCMIKLFLTNASILENMTLVPSVPLSSNSEKQVKVLKQLLMIPRCSTCSVISLCEVEA